MEAVDHMDKQRRVNEGAHNLKKVYPIWSGIVRWITKKESVVD
jgi:hypothetical protein